MTRSSSVGVVPCASSSAFCHRARRATSNPNRRVPLAIPLMVTAFFAGEWVAGHDALFLAALEALFFATGIGMWLSGWCWGRGQGVDHHNAWRHHPTNHR